MERRTITNIELYSKRSSIYGELLLGMWKSTWNPNYGIYAARQVSVRQKLTVHHHRSVL